MQHNIFGHQTILRNIGAIVPVNRIQLVIGTEIEYFRCTQWYKSGVKCVTLKFIVVTIITKRSACFTEFVK